MTIADVCRKVVDNMNDGLACAIVDVNTGMLLGVHHLVPHFTTDYLDAVAAASVEMFSGRTVKRIEQLLSSMSGVPVQESFEEIFTSSPRVFHFMKLIREKQVIIILVTRKSVSQGMGWASLRNSVTDFMTALP
ncbi:MAG: hypothetical protein OEU26_16225 [Candidatus Tectomicrobia bacterium]|nr:hypothetical protein [Candidatus Tectomicrobia bacterium]